MTGTQGGGGPFFERGAGSVPWASSYAAPFRTILPGSEVHQGWRWAERELRKSTTTAMILET